MNNPTTPTPQSDSVMPASSQAEIVLQAQGLVKGFGQGEHRLHILQGIDLTIRVGEVVAILGSSGVGKTTLLNCLGMLDRPDGGTIQILGEEVTSLSWRKQAKFRNQYCGFIFQFYHLLYELNALDNVLLPMRIANSLIAWISVRKQAIATAKKLLADVGLEDRMYHRPVKLSGGEKQRVAIARALVNSPRILFCDEPTGNLDVVTARAIRDLLWQVNRTHQTAMVLVTHDLSIAHAADRVFMLREGGKLESIHRDQIAGEAAYGIQIAQDPGRAKSGEPE